MTSTINASTTGVGGVITTADNSGVLALQGAGTTGITINANGSIGLGTSPSYGTAGQPLLAGGSLAQPTFGTLGISAGGTGQTNQHDAFNALAPITSVGDLIIGDGTNSSIRLPIGTTSQVLTSNGTTATWSTPSTGVASFSAGTTGLTPASATTGTVTLGGTLIIANGGTNGSANPVAGAIAYGSGTTYAFTAAGTSSQVLLSGGAGTPTWGNQSALSVGTATNIAGGIASQIPYQSAAGTTGFIANGTAGQVLTSAGTSVPAWGGINGGTF